MAVLLLASMTTEFEAVYSRHGLPLVPPEILLMALLLVKLLFQPQRAAAGEGYRPQPALPLVRLPEPERQGLGPLHLQCPTARTCSTKTSPTYPAPTP